MSNNLALYQISEAYLEGVRKLEDLDLDDQTIADTLESLSGDLEVKATNVAMFVQNLESQANAIQDAAAKMLVRAKVIENRADKVREYLFSNMQRTGITKIESPYFTIAIKKNPPKVIITDAGKIPSDCYVYPEAPAPYPDKKLLAQKLKAGENIEGAHLETNTRLDIK